MTDRLIPESDYLLCTLIHEEMDRTAGGIWAPSVSGDDNSRNDIRLMKVEHASEGPYTTTERGWSRRPLYAKAGELVYVRGKTPSILMAGTKYEMVQDYQVMARRVPDGDVRTNATDRPPPPPADEPTFEVVRT